MNTGMHGLGRNARSPAYPQLIEHQRLPSFKTTAQKIEKQHVRRHGSHSLQARSSSAGHVRHESMLDLRQQQTEGAIASGSERPQTSGGARRESQLERLPRHSEAAATSSSPERPQTSGPSRVRHPRDAPQQAIDGSVLVSSSERTKTCECIRREKYTESQPHHSPHAASSSSSPERRRREQQSSTASSGQSKFWDIFVRQAGTYGTLDPFDPAYLKDKASLTRKFRSWSPARSREASLDSFRPAFRAEWLCALRRELLEEASRERELLRSDFRKASVQITEHVEAQLTKGLAEVSVTFQNSLALLGTDLSLLEADGAGMDAKSQRALLLRRSCTGTSFNGTEAKIIHSEAASEPDPPEDNRLSEVLREIEEVKAETQNLSSAIMDVKNHGHLELKEELAATYIATCASMQKSVGEDMRQALDDVRQTVAGIFEQVESRFETTRTAQADTKATLELLGRHLDEQRQMLTLPASPPEQHLSSVLDAIADLGTKCESASSVVLQRVSEIDLQPLTYLEPMKHELRCVRSEQLVLVSEQLAGIRELGQACLDRQTFPAAQAPMSQPQTVDFGPVLNAISGINFSPVLKAISELNVKPQIDLDPILDGIRKIDERLDFSEDFEAVLRDVDVCRKETLRDTRIILTAINKQQDVSGQLKAILQVMEAQQTQHGKTLERLDSLASICQALQQRPDFDLAPLAEAVKEAESKQQDDVNAILDAVSKVYLELNAVLDAVQKANQEHATTRQLGDLANQLQASQGQISAKVDDLASMRDVILDALGMSAKQQFADIRELLDMVMKIDEKPPVDLSPIIQALVETKFYHESGIRELRGALDSMTDKVRDPILEAISKIPQPDLGIVLDAVGRAEAKVQASHDSLASALQAAAHATAQLGLVSMPEAVRPVLEALSSGFDELAPKIETSSQELLSAVHQSDARHDEVLQELKDLSVSIEGCVKQPINFKPVLDMIEQTNPEKTLSQINASVRKAIVLIEGEQRSKPLMWATSASNW
eukprot:TRINITY_DN88964_c0_g1_i1.p1 TRINITY_DN88964_c0_g1~~TRINITY_DN88964_c0_g1_i1.p1  ORF type:complete len:1015 (+),score=204.62 TRINITY_DN88964_c0_g1_i1:31-3045(+)